MATDNKRRRDWLVADGNIRPLGYAQDATISAASALPSIPEGARLAYIVATGANVRWRDDGVDPTTTVGMPLAQDQGMWYNGDLTTIKFIEESATAVLNVSYYN